MDLLFLDTETGGTDPFRHSLLQVGAVAYHNKERFKANLSLEEYNTTEIALKINQLNIEELKEQGTTIDATVSNFTDFIKRNFAEKPVLVGHNIAFDKYFIRELFMSNQLNMDDFISHRMIDTMSILWGLHLAGKIPIEACSSSGAFKYFGVTQRKYHDALDDALMTVELFEKLIQLIGGNHK